MFYRPKKINFKYICTMCILEIYLLHMQHTHIRGSLNIVFGLRFATPSL